MAHIDVGGIELRSYLAIPEDSAATSGLVLAHGFPTAPREAASAGLRYSELADRIATQVGMKVLTFNFRGTGQSEGDFSLGGWSEDVRAAIATLRDYEGVHDVWLSGFGAGGALAIHAAGVDPQIRGVCSFSARVHFDDWADNADQLLEHCREFGMIRSADFPGDLDAWVAEIRSIRPIDVIGKITPRAVMLVHGSDDDRVPVQDARDFAAAAGGNVDLRIIRGAGHRLRHDPRIVALLLGWLDSRYD